MLRTHVKASSITNLTDARYFAAWGVKWLGFQLDSDHEAFIKPAMVKAMMEWVDGVDIIGEFGATETSEIISAIEYLGIQTVQIGSLTSDRTLKELPESLTIIQEIDANPYRDIRSLRFDLESYGKRPNYFLLDLHAAGPDLNSLPYPLEDLQSLCWDFPILLSMNFQTDNLEKILEKIQPTGIELHGGAEEKIGLKSFESLDPIFELLEAY